MQNTEWLVLVRMPGDLNAEILRGLLEARDIPVRLIKEGAATAYGVTIGPFGEAELLVPATHWEEAEQVLEEYESGELEGTLGEIGPEEPANPDEAQDPDL
jgi:hypothetical protein